MDQDGGDHDRSRAESVGEHVEENSVHILVAVVVMACMAVIVIMTVFRMAMAVDIIVLTSTIVGVVMRAWCWRGLRCRRDREGRWCGTCRVEVIMNMPAVMMVAIVIMVRVAVLMAMRVCAALVGRLGAVSRESVFMAMRVIVTVAMMCVSKCKDPDKIDEEAETTDGEELAQLLDFATACQTLSRLKDDLDADEPKA